MLVRICQTSFPRWIHTKGLEGSWLHLEERQAEIWHLANEWGSSRALLPCWSNPVASLIWGATVYNYRVGPRINAAKNLDNDRNWGFCCLLMWLITISAFNKRSLLLPVFLFLFWLVKFVCRHCTKKKKKQQCKPRAWSHKPLSHTCWALFFLVPSDQENSTHSILCQGTYNFFNYLGMGWLNLGSLWDLHFSSSSLPISAKSAEGE